MAFIGIQRGHIPFHDIRQQRRSVAGFAVTAIPVGSVMGKVARAGFSPSRRTAVWFLSVIIRLMMWTVIRYFWVQCRK